MSKYLVRLWDEDINLIDEVEQGWRIDEPAVVAAPIGTRTGQALANIHEAPCVLTIDSYGSERWYGHIQQVEVRHAHDGEAIAIGHFENAAHINRALEKITAMSEAVKRLVP